jgi:hypothetical protein
VKYHHNPEEYTGNHSNLVATVAVADYFCNIMGNRFWRQPEAKKAAEDTFYSAWV